MKILRATSRGELDKWYHEPGMGGPRSMNVKLIRHTLSPEELVAMGARLCYSKADIASLCEKVAKKD